MVKQMEPRQRHVMKPTTRCFRLCQQTRSEEQSCDIIWMSSHRTAQSDIKPSDRWTDKQPQGNIEEQFRDGTVGGTAIGQHSNVTAQSEKQPWDSTVRNNHGTAQSKEQPWASTVRGKAQGQQSEERPQDTKVRGTTTGSAVRRTATGKCHSSQRNSHWTTQLEKASMEQHNLRTIVKHSCNE